MNVSDMYLDGEYLKQNPTWDVEDAPWKADLIFKMIQKHHLEPKNICEVGCGSGEILSKLQEVMPPSCRFTGYEISPQAYELCKTRENDRLFFKLKNFTEDSTPSYDIILLIDLIEHLENYLQFLRTIKNRSQYKMIHIPLETFVLSIIYPPFLIGQRKKVGHLHHFTKEIALQMLQDLDYEILDYAYTAGYSLPRNYGIKSQLLKIPRWVFFPIAKDFTVKVFGGYSLLVLVK